MAQILVRGLVKKAVDRLKLRARENGRSLESEVRLILEEVAQQYTREEMLRISRAWRRRLSGRRFSDSTALIREDRDSR